MGIKKSTAMLGIIAAAMMASGDSGSSMFAREREPKPEPTDEEKKQKEIEIQMSNGLKPFTFSDNGETHVVYAINHKNAVRKYEKLLKNLEGK